MSEFDQSNLDLSTETPSGPVECLGQTFESDDARREHYTELLREKLKDPEFRKIEGFPIGEDEDILALSDPPYYTACPNPWIEDFVKHHGRPYDPDEKYHREPFAADVSEGKKGHPIYTAYSYHTKVPHRAIMRYILHYTEPGDIIYDGFCGTGMTSVAGELCGDREEVQDLGYHVDQDGVIFDEGGNAFSKIGSRKVLLNDLSTIATFISFSNNKKTKIDSFEKDTKRKVDEVKRELSYVYETSYKSHTKGIIDYTIWSKVFSCPECGENFNFYRNSLNNDHKSFNKSFKCISCGLDLNLKKSIPVFDNHYDLSLNKKVSCHKLEPVLIAFTVGKNKIRKEPDKEDIDLIEQLGNLRIPYWHPTNEINQGDETSRVLKEGILNVHQLYTKRNLLVLSALWDNLDFFGRSIITSFLENHANKRNRYLLDKHHPMGTTGGPLPNTLYISPISCEINLFNIFEKTKKKIVKSISYNGRNIRKFGNSIISTESSASNVSFHNKLDYIFIDPPFGQNISYSNLNTFWESWLKVFTNESSEAIVSKSQGKDIDIYRLLMIKCFRKMFQLLKPSRWITVEFSNTSAAVWNSIQTGLSEVGFIISNVSALDKQRGGMHAALGPVAVKQDLVISAYKPSEKLKLIFSENGDNVKGVWQFVDSHLKQLPVSKPKGGSLEFVAERDPRILYDRMLAFYIVHNTPVPLSSGEFQAALDDKYPDRDGMVFLPEQVAHYDKLAAKMENVGQMVVFVEDEKSAIGWLRQYLKDKPSTYSTINPDFMQQLSASWRKFETRPELSVLLDQNFLKYSGEGDVPIQISSHLSKYYTDLTLEKLKRRDDPKLQAKAKDRWYVPDPKKMADVEAQREKKLLSEFWEYAAQAGVIRGQSQTSQTNLPLGESAKKKPKVKKLKEVRTDAVRAGFMECQRNNQGSVILAVAEILPANVIEEDEQLQMIYDMAEMRAG